MTAYMQYEDGSGVVARWHGGEYIELGELADDGEFTAYDVINVWNHGAGKPRIYRTLAAFQTKVDEHLAEHEDES